MSWLEKEKKRVDERTSGTFDRIEFWKPKDGDNTIRIIPNVDADKPPFLTVNLHYINVKKKDGTVAKGVPVRCYTELGDDSCPLCKYAYKLMKSKSEEDIEKGKRYKAKEVNLYNVIDYASKKVLPYAAGKTVHDALIGYMFDYGDESPLDLETGKNWKIIKKQKTKGAASAFNVEYTVRIDPKASAVPTKMIQQIEAEEIDLATLYQSKEDAIVNAFLGYEDDEESDEAYDERTSRKASSRSATREEEEVEERPRRSLRTPPKEETKRTASGRSSRVVEEEEEEEKPAPRRTAAKAETKKSSKVVEDDDLDLDFDMDIDADLEQMGL